MKYKFTSSSSNNLKLDHSKYNIPENNNLYGKILNNDSKYNIAILFHKNGWNVRKSSFIDFEINNTFCEFELNGHDKEPLFSGIIDIDYFDHLIEIFDLINLKYSLELYNKQEKLIKKIKNY